MSTVISGYDERERALRAGASGFLRKPVDPKQLIAAIEGVSSAPVRRGRVLVVDDDPQICAICVEVLGNMGFDAVSAKDLATARRSVADHRPDLLLLDLMLPDGDGYALCRKASRTQSRRRQWSPVAPALSARIFAITWCKKAGG